MCYEHFVCVGARAPRVCMMLAEVRGGQWIPWNWRMEKQSLVSVGKQTGPLHGQLVPLTTEPPSGPWSNVLKVLKEENCELRPHAREWELFRWTRAVES